MRTRLLLFLVTLLYVTNGLSQTIDFNTTCGSTQACLPFHGKPKLCIDQTNKEEIKFINLYGSPKFITFKKRVNNQNVDAKAVHFRSQYQSIANEKGDGLALEKEFKPFKVYRINVVSTGLRGAENYNFISKFRLSLDFEGTFQINPFDTCGMMTALRFPSSRIISDIQPKILDTMRNFADVEAHYSDSYDITPTQIYRMLSIRPLQMGHNEISAFMLHKLEVKELNFEFSQSKSVIYCDIPETVTFTLINKDQIKGVTGYRWNLGSASNGWKLPDGSDAPQIIETTTNSIALLWNGAGSAPSQINVIPFAGADALDYSYNSSMSFSSGFPPSLGVEGNQIIVTTNPSNNIYKVSNIAGNLGVTWQLTPSTSIGTLTQNGNEATFSPYIETSGTVEIKATVSNSCGASASYPFSVSLKNTCDTINAPNNLYGTPVSPGYVVLKWNNVPSAAFYTVEYKAIDGSNFATFTTTTNSCNYYGPNTLNGLFRVKVTCNSGKISNWSSWQTFNIAPPSACNLATATNLIAINACGNTSYLCGYITYNWTAVTGATLYEIESVVFNASTGQAFPSTLIQTSKNSGSYTSYPTGTPGLGWSVKFRIRSRCSNNTWTNYSSWSATFALN